ncbi:SPOR domain-containing protein [Nitrosomonas sp.]|uniref:SPOR domain-containing protein n=1 Tax=Nitrosomonas sp. TaxID=42353 RepID=UPI00283EA31F|nr:SPOR domain-containing protein [Nitrosomonas sp.]MDR4513342.1 SPOR domain-containing protein [Nitrosomonas sp.]
MNKNITEEELLLRKRARRRLVGAIVLVVAAVIILPMIFDEPKPDSETHEIDIHLFPQDDISEIPPLVLPPENFPPENLDQNNDRSELASDLLPDFTDALEPHDQLSATGIHDERMQATRIPIPGIKPKLNLVQPSPVQTERIVQSVQTSEQFVVQLGAFSDQSKAQQQLHNLRTNGLSAFTETHTVNGNVVTRVRIGPFSSRNAAESELEKLRRQGLDGVVTPR